MAKLQTLQAQLTKTANMEELICECGDSENMHIDNMEQCFNGDCGCKEFEEREEATDLEGRLAQLI